MIPPRINSWAAGPHRPLLGQEGRNTAATHASCNASAGQQGAEDRGQILLRCGKNGVQAKLAEDFRTLEMFTTNERFAADVSMRRRRSYGGAPPQRGRSVFQLRDVSASDHPRHFKVTKTFPPEKSAKFYEEK